MIPGQNAPPLQNFESRGKKTHMFIVLDLSQYRRGGGIAESDQEKEYVNAQGARREENMISSIVDFDRSYLIHRAEV